MLIKQVALLILGLEALLAWCWTAGPVEALVLAFAHVSIIAGFGVAVWIQKRPPSSSVGLFRRTEPVVLSIRREERLPRAA
jgi:hypothetical protein